MCYKINLQDLFKNRFILLNQYLVQLQIFWPYSTFCHFLVVVYNQPLNRSRWFFTYWPITPRHTQKNFAIYWYNKLCRFPIIITWCHKISTHFQIIFFLNNTQDSLLLELSCHIFIKKTSVEASVNVAAIFAQHFVRNCSQFVILWQLHRLDWFVNKLFGTWYTLLLCPFISKSDSSVVESSLRNPWIGGSNPGGKYTSFSVSRRMHPFSYENCSF